MASSLVVSSSCSNSSTNTNWDAGQIHNHPWLYIGSLSAVETHEQLQNHNIKRILTVAKNLPIATVPDVIEEHRVVEIDDHPKANFLNDAARECKEFIDIGYHAYMQYLNDMKESHNTNSSSSNNDDSVIQSPRQQRPPSLLVHCASGISRSATAILIWLMDDNSRTQLKDDEMMIDTMKLDEALFTIRTNRPLANPNIGFMMQLQVFEKQNGNLDKAINIWNSNMKTEIYEHVSCRRRIANHFHKEVDEIEVQIQTYLSQSHQQNKGNIPQNEESSSLSEDDATKEELLHLLNQISERLDTECDQNSQSHAGIPEDRVAKMIFKSARSKIERFIDLLSSGTSIITSSKSR